MFKNFTRLLEIRVAGEELPMRKRRLLRMSSIVDDDYRRSIDGFTREAICRSADNSTEKIGISIVRKGRGLAHVSPEHDFSSGERIWLPHFHLSQIPADRLRRKRHGKRQIVANLRLDASINVEPRKVRKERFAKDLPA